MTADRETLSVYNAKASDYDDIFFAGQAGSHLKRFMAAVEPGGRILDLGCGPGNAAALMQAEGFEISAVDASTEMVNKAQARGIPATVQTFDDISGTAIYDGVWANFSLLHAPRAALPKHLAALARAMKPAAAFHIGMKVGTGSGRDGLGRLYTYVTVDELSGFLRDAGIAPTHHREFTEVGMAGTEDACVVVQGHLSDG